MHRKLIKIKCMSDDNKGYTGTYVLKSLVRNRKEIWFGRAKTIEINYGQKIVESKSLFHGVNFVYNFVNFYQVSLKIKLLSEKLLMQYTKYLKY